MIKVKAQTEIIKNINDVLLKSWADKIEKASKCKCPECGGCVKPEIIAVPEELHCYEYTGYWECVACKKLVFHESDWEIS